MKKSTTENGTSDYESTGSVVDTSFSGSESISGAKLKGLASVGAIGVVVASVLMANAPKKSKMSAQIHSPSVPVSGSGSVTYAVPSIPDMSEVQKEVEKDKKPEEKIRKRRVVTYGKPAVKARPGLGEIPPGSTTEAVLLTGAADGRVQAKTTTPLLVAGHTLLPIRTKLVGAGKSGDHRLFVKFSDAVFPDGTFRKIAAHALDANDKIIGLKGSSIGNYALKMGAATGLNFAAGVAEGAKRKEQLGGEIVDQISAINMLFSGASTAALGLSQEVLTDLRNQRPRYEIEKGKKIFVLFDTK